MTIQQFIEELQRRHVFKVAGAYLVASWVAIEVSNTVFQILQLNNEYSKIVLYLVAAGLPITLILSWMFDFTKDGIVRTPKFVAPEKRAGDAGVVMAQPRNVVMSRSAAGMFGLGILVTIGSLAAYTGRHASSPNNAANSVSKAPVVVKSIAVLPLRDLSQKTDQSAFAQMMTTDLVSKLGAIENLQIVNGNGYADTAHGSDASTLAQSFNVDAVLEGTVIKDRDSIRVTVQVTDRNNKVRYTEPFTRAASNIFQVQDEIADAVASAMQTKVNPVVVETDGGGGSQNAEAIAFYQEGMDKLKERTDSTLRQAIGLFNQAIALDKNFARAYAGLAQTYAVLPTVGSFSFDEAAQKGLAAGTGALALKATLPEGHAAIGQIQQNLIWNPRIAESSYKDAIKWGPNYAPARQWYSETLAMLGRTTEAKTQAEQAYKLQPYSPAVRNTLGYVLTIAGDLDSALVVFRTQGALYPNYRLGQLTHALTAISARKFDEAETAARAYAGSDTRMADAMVTVIRGAATKVPMATAQRAAASLEPKLGPGFTALWFGALNDHDDALKMVQKAYKAGKDANFLSFVIHPLLNTLHGDAAYQKIVDELGLVPSRSGC